MAIVALYLLFVAAFTIACGCVAGSVARNRGRSYGAFFAFGFFFGVIGVLAAAFATRRPGDGEPASAGAVPTVATVVHHYHHYYDASGNEVGARVDVAGSDGTPPSDGVTEGQRIARAAFGTTVEKQPTSAVDRPPAQVPDGRPAKDPTTEGQRIARRAFAEKPVNIRDNRPIRAR